MIKPFLSASKQTVLQTKTFDTKPPFKMKIWKAVRFSQIPQSFLHKQQLDQRVQLSHLQAIDSKYSLKTNTKSACDIRVTAMEN